MLLFPQDLFRPRGTGLPFARDTLPTDRLGSVRRRFLQYEVTLYFLFPLSLRPRSYLSSPVRLRRPPQIFLKLLASSPSFSIPSLFLILSSHASSLNPSEFLE